MRHHVAAITTRGATERRAHRTSTANSVLTLTTVTLP